MKAKKTNINLDASAKEVHKALIGPIMMLAKILRSKFKGTYGSFEVNGWIELKDMHRLYLMNEFPGHCRIASKGTQKRIIAVLIKFNWAKWDKQFPESKTALEIDLTDRDHMPNHTYKVAIGRLNDPNFIQGLKDWLGGIKDHDELPWKTWEK